MITELVLVGAAAGVRKYLNKPVGDYELKVGYKNIIVVRKPIIVDMRVTAHLFVCGLSGNGKTKMVEYAMRNKKCVLLNAFKKDFKSIEATRIIGKDKMFGYLKGLSNSMKLRDENSRPFYVVIDELLVLCADKNIANAITDILAIGRHHNIFLIGISQVGTKEAVRFKDLFNARICFKQVEESSYRTILGYSPEDTHLKKREFYLYGEEIAKGYTYRIN
jgi:DNA segregation ATPase FtsK/SpoIIIE-like protein